MRSTLYLRSLTLAIAMVAGVGVGQAQQPSADELQVMILDLESRNQSLQQSLIEANRSEQQASEQLQELQQRLAALGKGLLEGGDSRLVQAAADLQIAQERVVELEGSTSRLVSAVRDFVSQAVVSNPDSRVHVETALRELDLVLGLRQKPAPDVRLGTLQQAKIVSIDQESGMLVLNLGETQGARIGMSFHLFRGQQAYGKATLADVRKNVCGAFIEQFDDHAISPRLGDFANLVTTD